MSERDAPRTFREVGMMVYELKDDVNEIKQVQEKIIARMDKNVHVLLVSILSPIVVGIVLTLIFNHQL
jgi:hypothetical protein